MKLSNRWENHHLILIAFLFISLSLFSCGVGGGGSSSSPSNNSATLSWDAPTINVDGTPLTDLAGYKVYYGASLGN